MGLKNILKGIACGVIYVSLFFWTMVLTFIHNGMTFILALLSPILATVIISLLLASESHRHSLYKWLISFIVGTITFLIYRETNFLYYWLNKILPGYGNISAGGGFVLLFFIMVYLVNYLVSIIISFYITRHRMKKVDSFINGSRP